MYAYNRYDIINKKKRERERDEGLAFFLIQDSTCIVTKSMLIIKKNYCSKIEEERGKDSE